MTFENRLPNDLVDFVLTGDSGGGLFVNYKNRFYAKGIVSASLLDEDFLSCNVTNYAIYTNVSKFCEWIKNPREKVSRRKG